MNDHDPMLDGITRYDSDDYDVELPEKPDGIYVLFSDLPALIAKVREDERGKVRDEFESDPLRFMRSYKAGIEQGQRDERERHANELDAAVAKARAEVVTVNLEGDFNYVKGYERGQRDEREACIAAVEEAACHDAHKGYYVSKLTVERVVAAIRAREEKS